MNNNASPSHEAKDLADRLHSAAIHLLRRLRRMDDASGLSAPKLSALSVIVYSKAITLGELAAAEQVRPPTMTRLVQDLEAAGLVTRDADALDRRVTRLRATAAGRKLLKRGRERRVAVLATWLQALPRREFATLVRSAVILEGFAKPH
jgi:DNA-binding MarR family transcriptional regulator